MKFPLVVPDSFLKSREDNVTGPPEIGFLILFSLRASAEIVPR
jgi:hypothetical protein